jgi:nucleoside-diphosphate-sugar epimerase
MKRVLVTGTASKLGQIILKKLKEHDYETIALSDTFSKLENHACDKLIKTDITLPESLKGVCEKIDCVVSCLDTSSPINGFTYLDSAYRANAYLLKEALNSGVSRFIYVSVLNTRTLSERLAKERFFLELKSSGIDYSIIHPNSMVWRMNT